MAKRKEKDVADEKMLSTPPAGAGQSDQDPAQGVPPAGAGQGNPDPVPGASPEEEGQNNLPPAQSTPPAGAGQSNQDPAQGKQPDAEYTATYEIVCRNKISKTIGGVTFVDGVGHTRDGYAASWFRNKEGYEVTKIKQ